MVKALWVIFMVLLPWLGVLVYLITQHEGWAQRNMREAARERDQLRQAVGFSATDELDKLDRNEERRGGSPTTSTSGCVVNSSGSCALPAERVTRRSSASRT
jgi:hypothetical protein